MDHSLVYLVQTDTTAGFLSSDDIKLSRTKQRDPKQKILQVVDSFDTLKSKTRVPNRFKNKIRRSKCSTFIYPNSLSFRVVDKNSHHSRFIKKFKSLYSTSANKTKVNFDIDYAYTNSDIVLYNSLEFKETKSSSIYKVNNSCIKKIR
ncbi:MAG: Sua5 YciO YrdC YwlC family protein [Campylobacterota bacterium]|nr:Sua5 YciO YrdC YwlC family protein [Campylobacterota bacterium]